jgi:hypothetical protein
MVLQQKGRITAHADGAENAEATVQDAEAEGDIRAIANQGEGAVAGFKDDEAADRAKADQKILSTKLQEQLGEQMAKAKDIRTDLDNKIKPNECIATCVMVFASLTTAFALIFATLSQTVPEPVDGNETTYHDINHQTLDEQIGLAGNIISVVFGGITTLLKQLEQKDKDEKEKDQKKKDDLIGIMNSIKICIYNLENATDEELKIRIGDGKKVLAEVVKGIGDAEKVLGKVVQDIGDAYKVLP